MKRRARSGFTLIELLIVVLIIAVLVVVLVAVLLAARGKGDVRMAQNFVDGVLTEAISRWQEDAHGGVTKIFPPSGMNRTGAWYDGNAMLFDELVLKPEAAGKAPYLGKDQFARGPVSGRREGFIDPWGQPYIYRNFSIKKAKDGSTIAFHGKAHNPDTYDVISAGPDTVLDTDDDIINGK
jgi:prepilin-type N-terminal cleavage/methylation domain-containing protein